MAHRLAAGALLAAAAITAHAQRPATALELFVQRGKGHCIACHQLPAGVGPATRSDLGPALDGTRMRALGKEAMRRVISDPTAANPETVMPPYGKHHILEPAEIDRLVEFLDALP
ncbi:MAG TPA: sulfur oxidation c-type cytochrome SoxX [Usitatibacter sp.]|jgi:sulfur-oxidizing protein SoxX|nr:sulfur oxidation c-type cytochrome SoxX [Usitatibacter sp.]